jgi:hypothetical protein
VIQPYAPATAPATHRQAASLMSPVTSLVPNTPFIHGVSAPLWQLQQQQQVTDASQSPAPSDNDDNFRGYNGSSDTSREYLPHHADDIMEKANRGEVPRSLRFVDVQKGVPTKPFVSIKSSRKRLQGKSKKRR